MKRGKQEKLMPKELPGIGSIVTRLISLSIRGRSGKLRWKGKES